MKPMEKRSLISFFMLAYAITWASWIIAFFLGYQDIAFTSLIQLPFERSDQVAAFLVFRIGVYGPLIASLVVTWIYYKSSGLQDLREKTTKWRVERKWYLYMMGIPLVINLLSVLIGIVLGVPLTGFFNSGMSITVVLLFLIYQIFTSGLEEPGWRGFGLEILQKQYTAEQASWILGLLWAAWHYPYVIFLYLDLNVIATIATLAGFTMAIIGQAFIFTWLYNNTRSVLVAILFHAWLNTSTTYILGDSTISNPIMGIIPAVVTWGIVVVLLKLYGGETLQNP